MSAPASRPDKQERSERPLIDAIERPSHVPIVDSAGEFFGFVWEGFRGFRLLPKFTAEVLRQIGSWSRAACW